jgi:hypothetical protein
MSGVDGLETMTNLKTSQESSLLFNSEMRRKRELERPADKLLENCVLHREFVSINKIVAHLGVPLFSILPTRVPYVYEVTDEVPVTNFNEIRYVTAGVKKKNQHHVAHFIWDEE